MKKWKKILVLVVFAIGGTGSALINNERVIASETGVNELTQFDLSLDSIIPVSSIKLNLEAITLEEGQNRILGAIFEPRNATEKGLTWSSSNLMVASVSAKGMVTAKGPGQATIAAKTKDGNKLAISVVTVEESAIVPLAPVSGIKINLESFSLGKGKNRMLAINYEPKNVVDKTIIWSSSNKKVATISDKGMVSAKGVGEVIIVARTKDGNKMATSTVTVTP